MVLNIEISDELLSRLKPVENKLPEIIELGMRELLARKEVGYHGAAEVLEFLAKLPSPEEIIELRPTPSLQAEIDELLAKNRTVGLSPDEEERWERYQYLEHLVRVAKAESHLRLQAA